MATLSPIPQPPTVPFLANVPLMDRQQPNRTFKLLSDQYGEIYQFQFPDGRIVLHINTHNFLAQISDDKRFKKVVTSPLDQVRNLVEDGLFTGNLEEPNWAIAHRILMPAFGTANTRNMFQDMKDICGQLMLKWERFGPENVFDPAEDFTRLTFDTIALCSMSHRFNSFYEKDMPKFTKEMTDVLIESTNRAYRSPFSKAIPLMNKAADDKYFSDIKSMMETAQGIVRKRKEHPTERKDLLALMLEGKDPKTGERLSDRSIVYNLITFLVAGHETTSGMLTFTTYHLLKNPDAMQKLREELELIVGDDEIRLEHLDKLEYLTAVMRESLRLTPTATARSVMPFEDTYLIGGDGDASNPTNKKYEVKKGIAIMTHLPIIQTDPRVWGEDSELFRPERMLYGKFENLPAQAWQPFGYGLRGCIGRPFAWQEAQLVLASIFKKFNIFLSDPGYKLQIKQTLTVKPAGLRVRVVPRLHSSAPRTEILGKTVTDSSPLPKPPGISAFASDSEAKVLYVFYGSNTGSSEGFAGRIASDAISHGFVAKLATLDSATGHVPTDGLVIIVTASFEGEPADNAAQFVNWIQSLPGGDGELPLAGVAYAVFGCGNREWARTYQRIPTLCDNLLKKNGAERLMERGEADAASASFFQSFDDWEVKLWEMLEKKYKDIRTADQLPVRAAGNFEVEIVDAGIGRAKLLRQPDAAMGGVIENRLLSKPGTPAKRHIEIVLPTGMEYRAGDYLAILPKNPPEIVERVLACFDLSLDAEIVIRVGGATSLPSGSPIPCKDLLNGFVELTQPATTRDIQILGEHAVSEGTASALKKLREDFGDAVLLKRVSIADILELYPDIKLPFAEFLRLLPPMRVRQYSISSSPLATPRSVSLTVSVINAPALSDSGKHYLGIASNYLANLSPGDRTPIVVRPSNVAFHLPNDPLVPIVMFCAGSGLAPFRGFIQERAAQKAAGRVTGKTVLFFGCRSPEEDFLYSDSDLSKWSADGVVDIRPAFSRKTEASEGCKYVQDRVWASRDEVIQLYRNGAKFFTCGSRKASNGIKNVCIELFKHANPDFDDTAASAEFDKVQKERYASDVFD
ncbi:hypothetical protein M0805_002171 [Coniferiporia weirii]|nr:hypothetical protein M0805_002171 [Coniferiporia weirii]